jgi:hypothetical protein
MNKPNHISESLVTIFWAKTLKFFDEDPGDSGIEKFGSGMEKIRIKDKRPGSTTLLPHVEKKGKDRVQ